MDTEIRKILKDLKQLRILIAEDDEVSAKVLERLTKKLGYKSVVVPDGKAGWEAFQKYSPLIVLTDWLMPEMTGLELCQKIRATVREDYTYVILLSSAFTSKENYQEAMDAGADDFLRKPIDKDELAARLRVAERIIGFHSQVRELRQLLPICSYCKSVRDDQDYWHRIETYIENEIGLQPTHGICPVCAEKHFKHLLKPKSETQPHVEPEK